MRLEDYNAMNNMNRGRSPQTKVVGAPPKYVNGVAANGQHRSASGNRNVPTNRISFNSGPRIETTVTMIGDEKKFGFSITGGSNNNQFPKIDNITPDSAGSRADLQVGDEIVQVNGLSLVHATHEEIITSIHRSSHKNSVTLTVIRDEPAPPACKKIGRVESKKLAAAARTDSFSSDSSDSADEENSIKIDTNGEHNYDNEINPREEVVPEKNGIHKFEVPVNGRWVESAMSVTSSEKTSDSHDSILKEDEKPEEILIRWDEIENENVNEVTDTNGHQNNKSEIEPDRKPDRQSKNKNEKELESKSDSEPESRPPCIPMTNGINGDRNDIFLPLNEDAVVVDNSRMVFSQPSIEIESPTSSNGPTLVEEEPLVAVQRTRQIESIRTNMEWPSSDDDDDDDDDQTDAAIPMRIEEDLTLIGPNEKEEDDPELDLELLQSSLLDLDEEDGADLVQNMKKDKTLMAAIKKHQTGETPPRSPEIGDQSQILVQSDSASAQPIDYNNREKSGAQLSDDEREERAVVESIEALVNTKTVVVNKEPGEKMGITVVDAENEVNKDYVIIARIVKGSQVENSDDIKVGDKLLAVNGMSTEGLSADDVSDMMNAVTGDVTLVVESSETNDVTDSTKLQSTSAVERPVEIENSADVILPPKFHVRAQFTFDPTNEPKCPCPELALTVAKREIFHVCGNKDEDPMWWQAFKDDGSGNHNSKLAGIIPSKKFIEEREDNRKLASSESIYVPKKKGPMKFFCGGKNKKKNAKNSPADPPVSNANNPRVLSYEDVSLATADQWSPYTRPIVLVSALQGDANALQKRLVADFHHTTTSPSIHTTKSPKEPGERTGASDSASFSSRNTAGNDSTSENYIHVNQSQFEELDKSSKLIWSEKIGEDMFGVTIDSVINSIESCKTCIVVSPANSLIKLRNPSIRPFVVFLAAPNREILKENNTNHGYFLKDNEIQNIFSTSVQINDKFLHMMDDVIQMTSQEMAFEKLKALIHKLQTEAFYCPSSWLPPPPSE